MVQKISSGALVSSASKSLEGIYYRKSVSQLYFPVYSPFDGEYFAILKIQLHPRLGLRGVIGQGGFKNVYLAVKLDVSRQLENNPLSQPVYAWARVKLNLETDPNSLAKSLEEVELYKRMSGIRSVIYHGHCVYEIQKGEGINSEAKRLGILMEYCPNKLESLFRSGGFRSLPGKDLCDKLHEFLLIGLELEHKKIHHHDLKLENILISSDGRFKLCDYGLSRCLAGNPKFSMGSGSYFYTSPEEWRYLVKYGNKSFPSESARVEYEFKAGRKIYHSKGDVYAMGVLLWMFCFESHPFDGLHEGEHFTERECALIMSERQNDAREYLAAKMSSLEAGRDFRSEFIPLLRAMLDFTPGYRPTFAQSLQMLAEIMNRKQEDWLDPVEAQPEPLPALSAGFGSFCAIL